MYGTACALRRSNLGMQALQPEWIEFARCPACYRAARSDCGALPDLEYRFGGERIALPADGIRLYACDGCGLVYKSAAPAGAFLAALFERETGEKWLVPQDCAPEIEALCALGGRRDFDLLDVGAAGGALLEACAAAGVAGRRSALDVVRYPGLERALAGEFIAGFLDCPALEWSGVPYDAVTAFDVLEHLYDARAAFANLRALLGPRGLLLVETGDARSAWPVRYGPRRWWYARLIEHHIFWTRQALERCAAEHGLEVLGWEPVRHKSRRALGTAQVARDLLKTAIYRLAPDGYAALAGRFGRQGNQPLDPFAKDHFRAVLRRL